MWFVPNSQHFYIERQPQKPKNNDNNSYYFLDVHDLGITTH
jgi:hypothetical protein